MFWGKLGAVKNKEKSRYDIDGQDANMRLVRTLRAVTDFHIVRVAKFLAAMKSGAAPHSRGVSTSENEIRRKCARV